MEPFTPSASLYTASGDIVDNEHILIKKKRKKEKDHKCELSFFKLKVFLSFFKFFKLGKNKN